MCKKIKFLSIFLVFLIIIMVLLGCFFIFTSDNHIQKVDKKVKTMGYGQLGDADSLSEREKITGYASVIDYGANPSDDKDDTEAFENAIKQNIAVYVPAGMYHISRPLAFNDQNFLGDGEFATLLVFTISDKNEPAIYLGGSSQVSLMNLSYDPDLISGKEKQGERVMIHCGATVAFGPGGGIKNTIIDNSGTAIRSDNSDGFGANNCTFEEIVLENISFRGFDIFVKSGYGSLFRSILMKNSKAESLFYFSGSGGVDQIENIAIQNCQLEYGIGYTQLAGVCFDNPMVEDTNFVQGGCINIKE